MRVLGAALLLKAALHGCQSGKLKFIKRRPCPTGAAGKAPVLSVPPRQPGRAPGCEGCPHPRHPPQFPVLGLLPVQAGEGGRRLCRRTPSSGKGTRPLVPRGLGLGLCHRWPSVVATKKSMLPLDSLLLLVIGRDNTDGAWFFKRIYESHNAHAPRGHLLCRPLLAARPVTCLF